MWQQNSLVRHSGKEEIAADESLLIYCKPVELYNVLRTRALHNPLRVDVVHNCSVTLFHEQDVAAASGDAPSFLQRCLHFKIRARQKRRLRAGIVIFNYRDCYNMLQKTEVTEDFSCPFCLMQCASFKGLRFHLCSSHDLFNFEYRETEDYQAVNVAEKIDILRTENVGEGVNPQSQTFFFCSRRRKRIRKDSVQNQKRASVKFLELDSPTKGLHNGFLENDDDILCCKGENMSRTSPSQKELQNGRHGGGNLGTDHSGSMDYLEHVASSFNIPVAPIAMPQSSGDPECSKSVYRSDPAVPAKTKKLNVDRSDSRNRMLLQKRQFFHSHRVQPMALEQVLPDRDSEDEVDNGIADLEEDLEDQRMLDDSVDVSKYEKQLMQLWSSFARKKRVLADRHVPWACEAFCKLHGKELISPPLFWSWKLFAVKLWNHGVLDVGTLTKCNTILDSYRNEGLDTGKN